ncbi:MAG: AAA-like domain-containing protein, partial [Phormidesmis sp.]
GSSFTPAQFWEYVLEPIKTKIMADDKSLVLLDKYEKCKNERFSNFALESLFKAIRQANLCFVLMIDEFDALVDHQVLNSTEFFGGLRSISSRSGGSMALIIASRQPIHALNTKTQAINPASSPFFNIFKEITLRGFPENDISLLLERAGSVFSSFDHQAIRAVAGRHPYLLQVAASALWEAYEDGIITSYARWTYMSNSIYQEQRSHFLDAWQTWSPATRKAFTTIALCSTEKLLKERTFLLQPFISDLRDVAPEIGDLEAVDLIVKDDKILGGWRIEPQVMTWWLADELVRIVRSDRPFDQWLQAQEMDNCLTSQEKENLTKFTRSVADILQQGITKFIDAFAEGIGKGLTSVP